MHNLTASSASLLVGSIALAHLPCQYRRIILGIEISFGLIVDQVINTV